jgi:hypothetical protein
MGPVNASRVDTAIIGTEMSGLTSAGPPISTWRHYESLCAATGALEPAISSTSIR